jgi:hypothetical protein
VARASERPALDVQAGLVALEQDIPRVLRLLDKTSIEELGWFRPNKLSLLIPMTGVYLGKTDDYVLRLGFQAYRQWPPSAQFVNPQTGAYDHPADQQHIPKLTSGECHTHSAYPRPGGGTMQLICCSATLEFYDVLHNVEERHLWLESYTFLTTIMVIRKAFDTSYQGRFSPNGN